MKPACGEKGMGVTGAWRDHPRHWNITSSVKKAWERDLLHSSLGYLRLFLWLRRELSKASIFEPVSAHFTQGQRKKMTINSGNSKADSWLKYPKEILKTFLLEFNQLLKRQYQHNWKWGQRQGTNRTWTESVMFYLLKKKERTKISRAAYYDGKEYWFPEHESRIQPASCGPLGKWL